jgi:hypothetical protein
MMHNSTLRPIWIVGAPRSGTTLLRSILDAHPSICCPPWETGVFDRLAPMIQGDFEIVRREESERWDFDRTALLAWMKGSVEQLMAAVIASSGKPRWCEKTPAHVYHMDLIAEVFPDSQFIHIIRNGWDVVKSLRNMSWAPKQISWSIERWKTSVSAGQRFGKSATSEQYTEIRYEDLCREPEQSIRQICTFLCEPFAEHMLEFHKPQNNSWGRTADALNAPRSQAYRGLTAIERLCLRWKAGDLLRHLGYA